MDDPYDTRNNTSGSDYTYSGDNNSQFQSNQTYLNDGNYENQQYAA